MTSTDISFSFRPEGPDAGPWSGVADDVPSAISGAWAMARQLERFVIISDHRDDAEGVPVFRVGIEALTPDEESEPATIRQTVCRVCGLEVEVDLTDPRMPARDRGGNTSCTTRSCRHDPVLSGEDWDAFEYHTGESALAELMRD